MKKLKEIGTSFGIIIFLFFVPETVFSETESSIPNWIKETANLVVSRKNIR